MPAVKKPVLAVGIFLAMMSWFCLFPIYRPAQIDDAWTASYVWNLTHLGTSEDLVMGGDVSNISYFGHIHAHLVSFLADAIGWTHAVFHGFNVICLLLAAPAWYLVGRRLLNSGSLSALSVIFLYWTEAFIGCAYTARSDALVFMLVSWAVYCASTNRFFLAALLCSISVEVHVISVTGYFYLSVFLLLAFQSHENRSPKHMAFMVGKCVLGILVGFAVYRLLHIEPIKEIFDYLLQANQFRYEGSFNALTAHYFHRAYLRFVPELFFLLIGTYLFLSRNRWRENFRSPLFLLFMAALLASVIIRRGNFKYVVFFYPPLFFLAVAGYWRVGLLKVAGIAFAIYCLTLSGLLAYQNRHIDRAAFNRDILQSVPQDERPIIGPSNAWFALRERFFYENYEAWLKSKPSSGLIYFIDSQYSNSLPPCARLIETVGPTVTFNRTLVEVFSADLSLCLESR